MINKKEAKLETSMIFVQPTSRLMEFLMGWLLVLGLKERPVECATACVKSVVILTHSATNDIDTGSSLSANSLSAIFN